MPHEIPTYVATATTGSGPLAPPAAATVISPRQPADAVADERPLRTLHQRWVTVVDGCFETEMECGDGEPVDALRTAWAHALRHSAEIKRELDTWIGNPLHDHLTEHHLLRLAQATGILRPGHSMHEALDEIEGLLRSVTAAAEERTTWLGRRRRAAEERRLIFASMRPS
ncbi:hypothetical protein [Nocardioides jiangxiensis]|uniref:DUF4254 domain-containing protein n=1 Tax=Nocardioides jiangxiensis TaxID=3064524 RepID=A0ABT9B1S9_9ACTN|nr:hypothetical protein [Nocardioides sp. WY-20]MDO7868806.1 hypothetical protein [Nocardioides sp. WY-20]